MVFLYWFTFQLPNSQLSQFPTEVLTCMCICWGFLVPGWDTGCLEDTTAKDKKDKDKKDKKEKETQKKDKRATSVTDAASSSKRPRVSKK